MIVRVSAQHYLIELSKCCAALDEIHSFIHSFIHYTTFRNIYLEYFPGLALDLTSAWLMHSRGRFPRQNKVSFLYA